MMNVEKRIAIKDHVTIHPDKSNVVLSNSHNTVSKKNFSLDMGAKNGAVFDINHTSRIISS